MLVLPTLGIVALGSYMVLRKDPVEEVAPTKNEKLEELHQQVSQFEKEEQELITLLKGENPGAQARADTFMDKMDAWLDKWDVITKELQDANGQWKAGYEGYGEIKRRISKIRYNINRWSGF